jgi:hypothetical protein
VTGPGWKIRNNGVKLGCVTASNSRKATVCAWTTAASAAEFPSVGEKGVRDREAQAIDDARTLWSPGYLARITSFGLRDTPIFERSLASFLRSPETAFRLARLCSYDSEARARPDPVASLADLDVRDT